MALLERASSGYWKELKALLKEMNSICFSDLLDIIDNLDLSWGILLSLVFSYIIFDYGNNLAYFLLSYMYPVFGEVPSDTTLQIWQPAVHRANKALTSCCSCRGKTKIL